MKIDMSSSGISPRCASRASTWAWQKPRFRFRKFEFPPPPQIHIHHLGIFLSASICLHWQSRPQTKSITVRSRVKHKKIFRMTTNLGSTQASPLPPLALPLTSTGCVLNMRWRGKLIFEKPRDLAALLDALLVTATRALKLKEVNP